MIKTKFTYKTLLLLLMPLAFTLSCQRIGLSPGAFASYCKEVSHGLIKTIPSGAYSFILAYRPQPLMALQEIGQAHPRKSVYDSVLKNFSGAEYFVLKVSADSIQTEKKLQQQYTGSKYDSVMNYVRFNMRNDFYLTQGTDTLHCAIYELENSGGINPAMAFTMAFDLGQSKDNRNDLIFHFQDKVFQHKPVVVSIENKNIKAIPALSLDSN